MTMTPRQLEDVLQKLIRKLQERFGPRLRYVGIQGSYRRGEADEHSDLDPVVILDRVEPEDLDQFRAVLEQLPDPGRLCGFLAGVEELRHWPPSELCAFEHDTRDCFGTLRPLLGAYARPDLVTAIRLGLGNLYHALVHTRVHAAPEELAAALPEWYQAAYFILRNRRYLETGIWPPERAALLTSANPAERRILELGLALRAGRGPAPETAFRLLFDWCRQALVSDFDK